jgi:hypothetical protein
MHAKTTLDPVIADHIAAINAFDTEGGPTGHSEQGAETLGAPTQGLGKQPRRSAATIQE